LINKLAISDYYIKAELYEPTHILNREFGFRYRGGDIIRHKAFHSIQKLRSFLIETSPDHVYFSCAKYTDPSAYPMEDKKKSWIGSDLIFDIDYDPCKPHLSPRHFRPTLSPSRLRGWGVEEDQTRRLR